MYRGESRPGGLRLAAHGVPWLAPLKLGADLLGVEGVAGGEVFSGLPQVGKRFLIAEDVQGLLHGLVLGDRDEHDIGAAVAGDGEVIVFAGDPVGELSDPGLRFGDGNGLHMDQYKDRSYF